MHLKDGTPVPSDATDAIEAGSAAAYHFKAGDNVVGDLNDDGIWQKGIEPVLLGVTRGVAIAFFAAPSGDIPVMTGLAVGDGFSGGGRVEGTVATLVNAAGKFTPSEWQNARIAKLILHGDAGGDLLAAGGIQNVTVLPDDRSSMDVSFASVRAGSAVDASVFSLNGGGKVLDPDYTTPTRKTDGADIKNLRLAHGANEVLAGDGFLGGSGGDLVGLKFGDVLSAMEISAGRGSEGDGVGGRGGNVADVDVKSLFSELTISAGDGASGTGGKSGGAGGKVTLIDLRSSVDGDAIKLNITGGKGGDGSYDDGVIIRGKTRTLWGGGGNGGDIGKISIDAPLKFLNVLLAGGIGGTGAFHAAGGAGGDVLGVKVAKGKFVIIDAPQSSVDLFSIASGRGGDGDAAGALEGVASSGGDGGRVSGLFLAGYVDALNVSAGSGGSGEGDGHGGRGGGIRGVVGNVGQVLLSSGEGGEGAAGGTGGDIVYGRFAYTDRLFLRAGSGGDGAESVGGNGGDVRDIRGDLGESPSIFGGEGGGGGKRGGEGGEVSHAVFSVTSTNGGGTVGGIIIGGKGGDAGSGGVAGSGGALRDLQMRLKGLMMQFSVIAGAGGDAGDAEGRAGAGGVIAGLHMDIQFGKLDVIAGDAGTIGAGAVGGGIGVSTFKSAASGMVSLIAGAGTDGTPGPIGPGVFVNGQPYA